MQRMSLRIRSLIAGLARNDRGSAAVEFAVIVPIMLTLFFGVLEFSSGIAVDRKVTLVARTMSDLTSQSTTRDRHRPCQLHHHRQGDHDAVRCGRC